MVAPHSLPRFLKDVTPPDPVVQRMETPCATPLGRHVKPSLQFSRFVYGGVGSHDHALALTCSDGATEAGVLPSSALSALSAVLRPPRTPARHRRTSRSALIAAESP